MDTFKSILYTPKFLYSNSQEFFKIGIFSANDYFERLSLAQQGDNNMMKYISVPAVNISFALELVLKGLHLKFFNRPPKGHSLLTLFSKLPNSIKLNIQQKGIHKNYDHFKIVEITTHDKQDKPFDKGLSYIFNTTDEILSNLKLQDNSFCDFRYMFEMGTKAKPFYFNFLFMANITRNCLDTLYELIVNDGNTED
jgi:hypothetical protein